jgi:hypothetical protein
MRIILTLSLAGILGACAAPLPPTQRMEANSAAIRSAEEVGAPKVPQAALHLQLAREQTEHAKALLAKGERSNAEGLLMRAEADANLAVALSRGDTSAREAQEAVDQARKLRGNP